MAAAPRAHRPARRGAGAIGPRRRPPWVAAGAAALATVALGGCFTGQRPTLAEGPASTGDPAIDAVLARLDRAPGTPFTASYDVLTRFGGIETASTVTQSSSTRRSITIGNVRFLVDGSRTATCDLAAGTCSDTIDAGRVSDVQLTPDFYAVSAASRLHRDAAARVGTPVASTEVVAGEQATCVEVPVSGGATTYCALDRGPLSRLDGADLVIEMTAFRGSPDEALFERPG